MNIKQTGFGGLQMLLAVAVIGVVSIVAVPKYNAFMDKAKMSEAFNLAGESKRKLSQFYMVNNRFPTSQAEADAMTTTTISPPEYVRGMVIEPNSGNNKIMIKVFMKDDALDNPMGVEQYIFIAGNDSTNPNAAIEWTCGGSGIATELLPENCQG